MNVEGSWVRANVISLAAQLKSEVVEAEKFIIGANLEARDQGSLREGRRHCGSWQAGTAPLDNKRPRCSCPSKN